MSLARVASMILNSTAADNCASNPEGTRLLKLDFTLYIAELVFYLTLHKIRALHFKVGRIVHV